MTAYKRNSSSFHTSNPSYDSRLLNEYGSRFSFDTNSDMELIRDIDRNYSKYLPLRLAIYGSNLEVRGHRVDPTELTSYINEQFMRLTLEYDPSSPIDYPGYMKLMLPLRVRHSFVKPYLVQQGTEESTDSLEMFVKSGTYGSSNNEINSLEIIEYAISELDLTKLDKQILEEVIYEKTPREIAKDLSSPDHSEDEIKDAVKQLRKQLGEIYQKYQRLSSSSVSVPSVASVSHEHGWHEYTKEELSERNKETGKAIKWTPHGLKYL